MNPFTPHSISPATVRLPSGLFQSKDDVEQLRTEVEKRTRRCSTFRIADRISVFRHRA